MTSPANPQLQGLNDLEGTYLFDLRVSNRALKLNRFFWNMIDAQARAAYVDDPGKAMADAGLNAQEQALVLAQDWIGLVRYGANFFVLEKFARVVHMTNLAVYASMRGETLEEFMQTRQVPSMR